MKYEIKTNIYCKFHFSLYPMDKQNCSIKIGSGSNDAIFRLYDKNNVFHTATKYEAVGLVMDTRFFGEENNSGKGTVGFFVVMDRLMGSFLMKYYIPCAAIVIVSEIGYMIPLTALPGRIGLLVTQFLTLINLFIHQMVS